MRRPALGVIVAVVSTIALLGQGAAARAQSAFPDTMAAVGDSITRAFDVNWSYLLRDAPRYSWSTGYDSAVASHYRRLVAVEPALSGRAYNDAVSGAKSRDLAGQLARAATQQADYVTVEIGANDVCTPTAGAMTPVATFESNVRAGLAAYAAGKPDGKILLASIPNVYQLWLLFRFEATARSTWEAFGICQSMLDIWASSTTRQAVQTRERAFNDVLARVCKEFVQCRWDGYAVFNYAFTRSDVSTVDYFHPSVTGQNRLAAITWAAGYWPTT